MLQLRGSDEMCRRVSEENRIEMRKGMRLMCIVTRFGLFRVNELVIFYSYNTLTRCQISAAILKCVAAFPSLFHSFSIPLSGDFTF